VDCLHAATVNGGANRQPSIIQSAVKLVVQCSVRSLALKSHVTGDAAENGIAILSRDGSQYF